MTSFLIQVSGHRIEENADPRYREGATGPRYCDEPLVHGEYFNAAPFWQREGFGRRDAWETIAPGDTVLCYCTGSVDEHGACLSHLLPVDDVSLDASEGARLTFAERRELVPKIPYSEIQDEIAAGRFSESMSYCGQEGFNITQIADSDIERVRELAESMAGSEVAAQSYPDESLDELAEDYFDE